MCGNKYHSASSLRQHQLRYCRGADANDTSCTICERSFKSFAGLQQHRKKAHPVEYNEDVQEEDVYRRYPICNEESEAMAREEATFSGTRINVYLSNMFGIPANSIIYHRKKNSYRQLVRHFKDEHQVFHPTLWQLLKTTTP